MITWQTILTTTQNGNPPPSRRVEKTIEQWREKLTENNFTLRANRGQSTRLAVTVALSLPQGFITACVAMNCCSTQKKNLIRAVVGHRLLNPLTKMLSNIVSTNLMV